MGRASGPGRPAAGFTLLEVLVVVFLLGIVLGAAGLALGDGGRRDRLQSASERLRGVLELAGQEALVRGVWLGASFHADGYEVRTLRGREWVAPAAGEPFARRRLPPGVGLTLRVEGEPQRLPAADAPAGTQVMFTPDGEITRFEVELSDRAVRERWRLRADVIGRVALTREAAPL